MFLLSKFPVPIFQFVPDSSPLLQATENCYTLLSLNNGHLSHKSLFYKESGSFILLRDVNVMLKNDTIIFPMHIILD